MRTMTPLAQMITNLLLDKQIEPGATPWFKFLQSSECHCFEVSAVQDLADQLICNHNWRVGEDQKLFLPSPKTWLEWRNDGRSAGDAGRYGTLLEEWTHDDRSGERRITINECMFVDGELGVNTENTAITTDSDGLTHYIFSSKGSEEDQGILVHNARTYCAFLSLINTPRIIGRRDHMPHAGLQRKLARSYGMVGKFPLHAWTEIKLEVATIRDDGRERVTHLSGGKALHFCRAHLRLRLGKVEIVSSHWRGDPSLGIKQTRYSVIPPRH